MGTLLAFCLYVWAFVWAVTIAYALAGVVCIFAVAGIRRVWAYVTR